MPTAPGDRENAAVGYPTFLRGAAWGWGLGSSPSNTGLTPGTTYTVRMAALKKDMRPIIKIISSLTTPRSEPVIQTVVAKIYICHGL